MSNPLNEKLQTFSPDEVARLYKNAFDSEEGRLMLEDLKNRCYIYTTPFAVDNPVSNFNMGMQAVVLHIQAQLDYKMEGHNV